VNQEDFANTPGLWEMVYESIDPECRHSLPGDWEFGGATDQDPRADPRWQPITYVYFDKMMRQIWMTQEPMCVHQAKGPSFLGRAEHIQRGGRKVHYITAALPGNEAKVIYSDMEGVISVS